MIHLFLHACLQQAFGSFTVSIRDLSFIAHAVTTTLTQNPGAPEGNRFRDGAIFKSSEETKAVSLFESPAPTFPRYIQYLGLMDAPASTLPFVINIFSFRLS